VKIFGGEVFKIKIRSITLGVSINFIENFIDELEDLLNKINDLKEEL